MHTKALARVEIKDADKGQVSAVFATLNTIDSDGDVTLPGAFTDGAPVRMSAYGHRSWSGELPVGRGVIREKGDEAIFEGQFFLDTAPGRDTFATVKGLGDLGEWSYSLDNIVADKGEFEGREVRFLRKIDVHEVSPVLKGAGVGTRTLAVKSGLKFSEHAESVLADVGALITRASEVVALRAEKGKTLAEESADLLAQLDTDLERLKALLVEPPTDDDAVKEWAHALDLLAASASFQGVTT